MGRQQDSDTVPKLPAGLNSDAQWAAAIRWLQFWGLVAVIKPNGDVKFELKNPAPFAQTPGL